MSDKKLAQAQKLIDRGKYEQARGILQPLAFSNEQAKQMLDQLNSIAPPSQTQKKRRSPILACGCLAAVIGIVACVGFAVVSLGLLAVGTEAVQEEAIEANGGLGSEDEPIPAGSTIVFDDFNLAVTDVIYPATARIERDNMFNDIPPSGTDYALVEFQLDCKKSGTDLCRGGEFSTRLVDPDGEEWRLGNSIVVNNSIDNLDGTGGNSFTGFKAFTYPVDTELHLVKITVGSVDLYVELPQ